MDVVEEYNLNIKYSRIVYALCISLFQNET